MSAAAGVAKVNTGNVTEGSVPRRVYSACVADQERVRLRSADQGLNGCHILIGARIYAALSDTYWRTSHDVAEALAVHGIRRTPRSIQRDLAHLAPLLEVDSSARPFLWRRR